MHIPEEVTPRQNCALKTVSLNLSPCVTNDPFYTSLHTIRFLMYHLVHIPIFLFLHLKQFS